MTTTKLLESGVLAWLRNSSKSLQRISRKSGDGTLAQFVCFSTVVTDNEIAKKADYDG
jgi:hypothetical protein